MTREAAVWVLKSYNWSGMLDEVRNMAIEALSSSELPNNHDAISRQAVFDIIEDAMTEIGKLQFVMQEQKTGWIPRSVVENIKAEIQTHRNNNSNGEYDKIFELCLLIIDRHINGKESEEQA